MKKFLIITIDVEPDCSRTWHYSDPLTFEGVSKGIGEILQPLFNKYNMAPTYLINNVVLEDKASCEILQNLPGKYELGTHLHPEFIEPEKSVHNYAGQRGAANCCEYLPEVEYAKLAAITRLFEERFGYAPKSFRAGRFSAGSNTIASLEKLGYTADTSVTPHVCWSDRSRLQPINHSDSREQPYFLDSSAYPDENRQGSILEIPVSISTEKSNLLREIRRTWFGFRRPFKKVQPVWLRPAYSSYNKFVKITEDYQAKYRMNPQVIFNMMFHNVEVLPGLSPYTRNERECGDYLESLEKYFNYCAENDIKGITLNEATKLYSRSAHLTQVVQLFYYLVPTLSSISTSVTEMSVA